MQHHTKMFLLFDISFLSHINNHINMPHTYVTHMKELYYFNEVVQTISLRNLEIALALIKIVSIGILK